MCVGSECVSVVNIVLQVELVWDLCCKGVRQKCVGLCWRGYFRIMCLHVLANDSAIDKYLTGMCDVLIRGVHKDCGYYYCGKGRGNLLALVWSIHTLSLSYSGWFCIKSLYMAVLDWIIWISRNRIFVQMCFWFTINGKKIQANIRAHSLTGSYTLSDWPNLLIAIVCG